MYATHSENVLLEITPPAYTDMSVSANEALFSAIHSLGMNKTFLDKLLGRKSTFSNEISSTNKTGIRFFMRTPIDKSATIQQLIASYLPDAKVQEVSDYLNPDISRVLEFKQSNHYAYPLKSHEELESHDPIGYLTSAMTKLGDDEQISIQITYQPVQLKSADSLRYKILRNENFMPGKSDRDNIAMAGLGLISKAMFWVTDGVSMAANTQASSYSVRSAERDLDYKKQLARGDRPVRTLSYFEHELIESVSEKLKRPLFKTTLRVTILSPDKNNITKHRKAISSALGLFEVAKYQSLKLKFRKFGLSKNIQHRLASKRLLGFSTSYFSSDELAGLYHFPNSISAKTENVIKSLSKTLPASVSLKDGTKLDVILGMNKHHGSNTLIGLTAAERERHMYIIGGTGNGKTTMLEYAIIQDIKSGKGVAVIDPHGDSSRNIISHIPKERIKDVIYLNPRDLDHPIGLNLLELPAGLTGSELAHAKDMATEAIISVLQKIFDDNADTSAYKIERTLRNAIHTAFVVKDTTLFTVLRLLTDIDYRKKITRKLKDESLIRFWKEELGKAGDMQRVKISSGPINRIERFERSESAKRMIEQPKSTIDFDDILNSSKILICNFPKGRLGEDTSTLMGTTVLAMLQLAAWRRDELETTDRVPFYLYVDEFQNFASQSFLALFSEARKYKLYLTMAQQSVAQLQDSSMINTILDNVGTIVGFRSKSPATEQLLLHQFSPQVEQGEILNIPSYNFYIKIAALQSHEPMSGETLLLDNEPSPEIAETVIAISREKYAIKYGDKVEDRNDGTKKDEPGKKSKSKNNDNNIKASKSGEEDKSVDDFDVPDVNA